MKDQILVGNLTGIIRDINEEYPGENTFTEFEKIMIASKLLELTMLKNALVLSSTDKYPGALEMIAIELKQIQVNTSSLNEIVECMDQHAEIISRETGLSE